MWVCAGGLGCVRGCACICAVPYGDITVGLQGSLLNTCYRRDQDITIPSTAALGAYTGKCKAAKPRYAQQDIGFLPLLATQQRQPGIHCGFSAISCIQLVTSLDPGAANTSTDMSHCYLLVLHSLAGSRHTKCAHTSISFMATTPTLIFRSQSSTGELKCHPHHHTA